MRVGVEYAVATNFAHQNVLRVAMILVPGWDTQRLSCFGSALRAKVATYLVVSCAGGHAKSRIRTVIRGETLGFVPGSTVLELWIIRQ